MCSELQPMKFKHLMKHLSRKCNVAQGIFKWYFWYILYTPKQQSSIVDITIIACFLTNSKWDYTERISTTEWKWAWRTDKSIMSAGGNPLSISPQRFSMILSPLGLLTTDAAGDHGKMGFTCPPRHIQINALLSNGKIRFVLLGVPIIQMFTDYLHWVAYITWSNRFSTLIIMFVFNNISTIHLCPSPEIMYIFFKSIKDKIKRAKRL